MEQPSLRTRLLVALVNVGVGLWGLRWWFGAASRHGDDTAGHLQRIEAAWTQFGHGRLDGWFDGAMLGYQLHLFYGPGLAAVTGIVRLLSLGRASSETCLDVVLVVAFLAVPWALARLARALGLDWWAAAVAGTLGLIVSSPFGGGIAGGFGTALAAQQVAVPLVLFALALALELVAHDGSHVAQRCVGLQLGAVLTAIAVTHPLSLAMTVMILCPLVMCVALISGDVRPIDLMRLLHAIGWFVGLSAFWWLPMVDRRSLRGPVTSWKVPGVVEHLRMFITGERGAVTPLGAIVAVAIGVAVIVGVITRNRRLVALGLLPLAAFVVLHAAHGLAGVDNPVGMQFPNRGLVYAALLSTPVTAAVAMLFTTNAAAWFTSKPTSDTPAGSSARLLTVMTWVCAIGLVAVRIGSLEPQGFTDRRVSPRLSEVADILAEQMEPGERFAYVEGPVPVGVPQPQRWFAWRAGRSGIASFGPEYSPGAGLTMALSRPPGSGSADHWLNSLGKLAVSHLVVADPELNRRLGATGVESERLLVWRLSGVVDGTIGSIIPVAGARMVHPDPETYVIRVTSESDVPGVRSAIGWSPGWSVSVDGVEVSTWPSPDDTVAFDLPSGSHELRFRFSESVAGPTGRGITLGTVMISALGIQRRRRRHRDSVRTRSPDLGENEGLGENEIDGTTRVPAGLGVHG